MKNLEPRKVAEEKTAEGLAGKGAEEIPLAEASFPFSPFPLFSSATPLAVTLADCRLPTAVLRLQASFGLVLLLAAVTAAQAATSNAPVGAKTNAPAAAPVVPAEMLIPKSQFSALLQSGKDPFYPDSVRRQQKISVTQTNQAVVVAPEVRINGFSGNAARPLVIINNVTFGEGDEQMVTTVAGRARVRCLKIRMEDQTVEIEINGQRREVKFLDRR